MPSFQLHAFSFSDLTGAFRASRDIFIGEEMSEVMKEIKSRDTTFLDDKFPSKTFAAKARFI